MSIIGRPAPLGRSVMSEFKDLDSFDTFLAIVAKLRGPDGCPWDKAQSHETLRRYIIEECHEAVDAIDEGDRAHLAEELGDVLLQVGLHAQIGADEGTFTIADVLRSINAKLLRRHPHVFAEGHASDADEVAANWQSLKEQERGAAAESVLDGAPNSLSALARSQELQRRAGKLGFEWEDIDGVLDKLREEIDEFKTARSAKEREHELGDILASMVNVARWVEVDAETAMRRANERFQKRFRHMEQAAAASGGRLSDLPLAEQEALWQQAKRELG